MTPKRFARLRATLDRRQPDLTVLTDQVQKPHNLSAIIRTCDAVGIQRIHVVRDEERFRPRRGTSLGAENWISIRQHRSICAAMEDLRSDGIAIYAANISSGARDYRELDYTHPCALLVGAEGVGVSTEAVRDSDCQVTIPMLGMVTSLNVSVAAAIILTEAQRQRQDAGMYLRPRLDPEEYRRTLFEWSYPRLARFCRQRGFEYPLMDEEGHIHEGGEWYRDMRLGKL